MGLLAPGAVVTSDIGPLTIGSSETLEVNLNSTLGPVNDGVSDVTFFVLDTGTTGFLNIGGISGSRVSEAPSPGLLFAERLGVTDTVGPSLDFGDPSQTLIGATDFETFDISNGEWGGGETGYVGLAFNIAGAEHYGFVRVTWVPDGDDVLTDSFAVVDQIGYNTIPGEPAIIVIPEPSASLIVTVSASLVFLRRRRRA